MLLPGGGGGRGSGTKAAHISSQAASQNGNVLFSLAKLGSLVCGLAKLELAEPPV